MKKRWTSLNGLTYYELADWIRQQLRDRGVILTDKKDGSTTWHRKRG